MDSNLKTLAKRLVDIRSQIVKELPFYGRLILHLQFGFADCETAYTDNKRIVFDPNFANKLDDMQLKFILLHELYHCVLNHLGRGKGKVHFVYNIACDIVVNSIILDMLGLDHIEIEGENVIYLSPNGAEGSEYDVDELYRELLKLDEKKFEELYKDTIDNHRVWTECELKPKDAEIWKSNIQQAANTCSTGNVPLGMRRYINEITYNPKCNWKQVLHDFIQFDRGDYTFNMPDRRFAGIDIIMPSFTDNIDGEKVNKLWAVVDTSGSISRETLTEAMNEIYGALTQINLSGWVSFFDCEISEPKPFESSQDLEEMTPVGGGGTDFDIIFDNIDKFFYGEDPEIIIILTDGNAKYPDENVTRGIPVIWAIIDSDKEPPWGNVVRIY